jgi:hypothetical protein
MESMPPELKGRKIYYPSDWAFEKEIKKRIEFFQSARERARKNEDKDNF